jgi:hypothetical protein
MRDFAIHHLGSRTGSKRPGTGGDVETAVTAAAHG